MPHYKYGSALAQAVQQYYQRVRMQQAVSTIYLSIALYQHATHLENEHFSKCPC
jgi:hypothetical protein